MTTTATADGKPATTRDLVNRLRRVEGQIRGITRMVEQDAYCIDVLTQVSAASRALQGVALLLLEDHMTDCLTEAARAGEAIQADKVREASEAIARLVRS